jgi:predicted metal-dependent peptidase
MPYLATAVFRLRPWWVDGLGTFAVDARWRVLLDPVVLDGWGVRHAAGVLLHEVGHALRGHAGQAGAEGGALDPWAWNLCGDAAINDDLVRSGVELPGRFVLPGDLHDRAGRPLRDGGTALAYYAALPRREVALAGDGPTARAPGTGLGTPVAVVPGRDATAEGSCGGVAGGVAHDVELPVGPDGAPDDGVGEVEQDLARRAVAEEVRRVVTGRPGTVPGGLVRWADTTLAPPVVSWRQRLRGPVRRGIGAVAGVQDPTYARPSRRRVPGVVLPGSRRPVPVVAAVVDTSASMGPSALGAVLTELDGIARAVGVRDGVRVLTVDAAVQGSARVASAREVVLRGGGGTDLRPGLAGAVRGRDRPDVVVVLTDGGTPWHDAAPDRRVRWVVVRVLPAGPLPPWSSVPGWADVVEIDPLEVAP